MVIKFFCDKHCADFNKTEEQLMELKPITHCPFCGQKLHIMNLQEIVSADIETKVSEYIDKMLKELGIEGAWELVERNREQACYRLYISEFKRRGISIK